LIFLVKNELTLNGYISGSVGDVSSIFVANCSWECVLLEYIKKNFFAFC